MGHHKAKPKNAANTENSNKKNKDGEDSESDFEEGHHLIESSVCRSKMISSDEKLEPYRRFWVEMRQK